MRQPRLVASVSQVERQTTGMDDRQSSVSAPSSRLLVAHRDGEQPALTRPEMGQRARQHPTHPGKDDTWIDHKNDDRAPLLLISGSEDRLMPRKIQRSTPSTDSRT